MMDEDDRAAPRASVIPRPLTGMSVAELEAYRTTLKNEIARIEEELRRHRDVRSAAESLFKKRDEEG